jgi:hypothetical protein
MLKKFVFLADPVPNPRMTCLIGRLSDHRQSARRSLLIIIGLSVVGWIAIGVVVRLAL